MAEEIPQMKRHEHDMARYNACIIYPEEEADVQGKKEKRMRRTRKT